LLVVSISRSAVSLATYYYTFLEQTCNGVYSLNQVNSGDKTFYRNAMLFQFTGQLLERANAKAINPVFEGDPEYFFSGGRRQVWLFFPLPDEFYCVRREDLGSRKCRISGIDDAEGHKKEGERNTEGG
jgi:hypothetical protein